MKYSAIITNGQITCNTAILPGPPEEVIPLAARYGFDGVQLTIGSPADYDIPALKQLLQDNGLIVTALATGRIYSVDHHSMGSDREENRLACVQSLRELTDLCADLDHAALIIGACRGKTSDAADPASYHRAFERSLREICRYAETLSVPVYLELIDYLESDCCRKLPETLEYVRRINSPVLHMYMDTMHLWYEKEDMPAVLREYGQMIPQLDISGEGRCTPMVSAMDFPAALTALKESGFDGVLTFEMDSLGSAETADRCLRYVKQFMEG